MYFHASTDMSSGPTVCPDFIVPGAEHRRDGGWPWPPPKKKKIFFSPCKIFFALFLPWKKFFFGTIGPPKGKFAYPIRPPRLLAPPPENLWLRPCIVLKTLLTSLVLIL